MDPTTKLMLVPASFSTVLALSPPCARGKSTAFHNYMDSLLETKPRARILLLSANILYGTSLTTVLEKKYEGAAGVDVGFYRQSSDLIRYNVVVCSLESLHHLDGQQFDAILIDEIRSISRLVGGGTLTDFNNIYLLKELCAKAAEIVVCDADLMFTMNDSEPRSLAVDFMKLVFGDRPIMHTSLSHAGPPHLHRTAKLLFDHGGKKMNSGKKRFFAELEISARAWHLDHSKRFAVCVGSKTQLREIYEHLVRLKVPTKPYSGDTNESAKFADLRDADSAWIAFGCIASTTSLSIGVDPTTIEFDRVFMWTHPQGCMLLAMFQAGMRYGRQADHPLGDKTICLLLKCMPPGERAKLVQLKKKKAIVPPTYEEEYKRLVKRRGAAARMMARELAASGGRSIGVKPERNISDQILRVMAHSALERKAQIIDHYSSVLRCIRQYKWAIEPESLADAESLPALDISGLEDVVEDADDRFAAGTTELEKSEAVLEYIVENGEDAFFNECFGLAPKETGSARHKSSLQQYLVRAHWLLKPIGRLPEFCAGGGALEGAEEDAVAGELPAAEQLVLLNKLSQPTGKVWDSGLSLNAHLRCGLARDQMCSDAAHRNDPDTSTKHKPNHPLIAPALGMRMEMAARLGKLLGLAHLTSDCELPDRIVEIARRDALRESTEADIEFVRELKIVVSLMQHSNASTPPGFLGLLDAAAKLLGHALIGTGTQDKDRVKHPAATAKDGRIRVVKFLRFKRLLPDMVDDWKIYSPRLGYSVCTANWKSAHTALDEEEGQLGLLGDAELDEQLYARPANDSTQRFEKLDGKAVQTELARLGDLHDRGRLTARDKRWLDWLRAADAAALPPDADGVRLLAVVYGKSAQRVIGRRTASHPSLQHCPSSLRPRLVAHYYHDVDMVNCHPTLMLQVAEKMGVPLHKIEKLREYVTSRQSMLERIGEHYGIPAARAKYGVLRVLNGGSIAAWMHDSTTGCSRGMDETQADLRDLEDEARVVRETFFEMPEFKSHVESLREEMTLTARAKVATAEARVRAASAGAKEQAQRELGEARRKASLTAIDRSLLSACLFELEDKILMVIVESFEAAHWTVSSFQFDGLHAEHCTADSWEEKTGKWTMLEAAMRTAERAVEAKLKYKIKLTEKALFEQETSSTELVDADDADALVGDAEESE